MSSTVDFALHQQHESSTSILARNHPKGRELELKGKRSEDPPRASGNSSGVDATAEEDPETAAAETTIGEAATATLQTAPPTTTAVAPRARDPRQFIRFKSLYSLLYPPESNPHGLISDASQSRTPRPVYIVPHTQSRVHSPVYPVQKPHDTQEQPRDQNASSKQPTKSR